LFKQQFEKEAALIIVNSNVPLLITSAFEVVRRNPHPSLVVLVEPVFSMIELGSVAAHPARKPGGNQILWHPIYLVAAADAAKDGT
jgi:hypothetical protein